ncbi:arginine--tRNA ligase [Mechercharimyces sp. CAU 1602]|uniref:arginine--tRNA ligase n=1 Tax=Mechercharimyces sp. CAU 1602 TaxID=2973933 RepID=UPI002867FA02|nr:arginine--tRNA ligase [Mechercharimyces sp. CAU 1602]
MSMSVLEKVHEQVKEAIREAIIKADLVSVDQIPEITLETPREKQHGDLATNVAMQLVKVARKSPRQIAEALVAEIDQRKAFIRKLEIAGPGFINFFMDRSYLANVVPTVLTEGDSYGQTATGAGKSVLLEYVSANPTGSLHLGHARGAAVGDALSNILELAGYKVTREYYINDAGNQMDMMARSLEARYLEALGKESHLPEDGYRGEDIRQLGMKVAAEEGERLLALSAQERLGVLRTKGLEQLLVKIQQDLGRYRVRFDHWFSETSLYQSDAIKEVLKELHVKGYTYEQDGALWFKSTQFGDDKDRVLVKQDGSYTYLTPDMAYHRDKFERGFDRVVNIWGADHHGYIARMRAFIEAMGYDSERFDVVITQMVKLYQGGELVKMSKRTGKAVTLTELLDEVGIDGTRYFFTMRSPDTHLDFDMDLAVSQSNDNPVFYVQYAHARICSVIKQASEQGITPDADQIDWDLLTEEQEYDLLNKLGEFPAEIALAAENMAPNRVIRYIFELASLFHSYYNAHRVIGDDPSVTQARLALYQAIQQVLINGLKSIGVSAPEKM